jgi:hypothetical protein
MTPPETQIAEPLSYRLIPSAIFKGPILRALVDDDPEVEALSALERMTSDRLSQRKINPDIQDWGSSCVEAAFAYRRKGGNRFNSEDHGAWYSGFDERTSLHEVAFHKTRELSYIEHFYDEVFYHTLQAGFVGRFHDVRLLPRDTDFLSPDIAIAYPAGQRLAQELLAIGSRGLIYPSARRDGGTCLVAFQEIVVQDVRPGAKWKLTWNGSPDWQAEAV